MSAHLPRLDDLLHRVAQVGAVHPVGRQHLEPLPHLLPEVRRDLLPHVQARRRREAGDRRGRHALALGELADEPGGVQVVRPEVVAPLRDAVRLVEDPRRDLALAHRALERAVAQLFGRHVQEREAAEANTLEHVVALGHRQQAVQRRRQLPASDLPVQVLHLVLHQRLQRGDHHGQRARPLVVHDRRELVAQRLAAAGRHDREQRRAGEAPLDDPRLQALAVACRRPGTESRMAEVLSELRDRVVLLPTAGAARIAAVHAADGAQQGRRSRERVVHPSREHRLRAAHRQPRERVGDRRARGRVVE